MKWFMSYASRSKASGRYIRFGSMLIPSDEHPITAILNFNKEGEEGEEEFVLLFYRELSPSEQAHLCDLDELDGVFTMDPGI